MEERWIWHYKSQFGDLFATFSEQALHRLHWHPPTDPTLLSAQKHPSPAVHALAQAVQNQLEEYGRGSRHHFELPMHLEGRPFQKQVWQSLLSIPYGATCPYSELARMVHKPLAVRAVATAVGQNPICLLLPCHRVIRSDGTIGGYSGGVEAKRLLLALEGNTLA